MKGVPLRLEIGPRDIEAGQCVLVRRDNREKTIVKLDELETKIPELLQAVHDGLYERALKNRQNRTFTATTFEEMKRLASEESGFIETMWCGDLECEMKVKEEAGLTSRCMPDEQKHIGDVCPDLRQARQAQHHLGQGLLSRTAYNTIYGRKQYFLWNILGKILFFLWKMDKIQKFSPKNTQIGKILV